MTGTHMKTKTIQQTVIFKAPPLRVYEILMDSRKHQSLSGERADISKKVGGCFTAWGSHISGFNLVGHPEAIRVSCRTLTPLRIWGGFCYRLLVRPAPP